MYNCWKPIDQFCQESAALYSILCSQRMFYVLHFWTSKREEFFYLIWLWFLWLLIYSILTSSLPMWHLRHFNATLLMKKKRHFNATLSQSAELRHHVVHPMRMVRWTYLYHGPYTSAQTHSRWYWGFDMLELCVDSFDVLCARSLL